MSLSYAPKHFIRSWHLFLALLLGIMLASAFFAGIDIKANVTAEQALDQQLTSVYKDMEIISYPFNLTQLTTIQEQLSTTENVQGFEAMSRMQAPATVYAETNNSMQVYPSVVGLAENSRVYDGWLNKPVGGLGANETYLAENANLKSESGLIKVGDVVSFNFSIYDPVNSSFTVLPLNLTVSGFAELDDGASSIISGSSFYISPVLGPTQNPISMPPFFSTDSLLVDWDKTVKPFLEVLNGTNPASFQQSVIVYINRESLISAWDIPGSISNLQVMQNNIGNKLSSALGFRINVQNNLVDSLQIFQYVSITLRVGFIIISLPIFFMAWYVGTTVSDVSFNSRRREIGLLSTKGFSTGQISRIFLSETILIGTIGSLLGVLLGFFLTPLFTSIPMGAQFSLQTISPYTIVFTVAFGLIMAVLSSYSSARRAARLSTIGALREYLPIETEKPYRKKLSWLAFILGTYKIIVFITGINMQTISNRAIFSSGNFILVLLSGIWLAIDGVLSYIGPLLFFWGFAKLFIQGSLKFQELTVRASRFLGDIGTLATKNVRRKPARAAAIAFIIALIVWYSVLVTGQMASEKDYSERQTYVSVGADVAANIANVSRTQAVLENILANVSGIKDATAEFSISAQQGAMTLKAVDPEEWLRTAYYEAEWFSGATVQNAFDSLAADNDTIILERSVAKSYNLTLGDKISVEFENGTKALRIVGLFGPEPQDQTGNIFSFSGSQPYWSFIPMNLYAVPGNLTSASAVILVKLDAGADGITVASNVRDVDADVAYVNSFAEQQEMSQTNAISTGALEVQQLGIVFAVLAASVGTTLISAVSMSERSREATIMSVKGLSYKQLVIMFLTENFALVTFATTLGIAIGLISVYGNISSSNTLASGSLVVRHFLFPLESTLLVTACVGLIFAATILPVIIMSRKYVTKLERMVRLR